MGTLSERTIVSWVKLSFVREAFFLAPVNSRSSKWAGGCQKKQKKTWNRKEAQCGAVDEQNWSKIARSKQNKKNCLSLCVGIVRDMRWSEAYNGAWLDKSASQSKGLLDIDLLADV